MLAISDFICSLEPGKANININTSIYDLAAVHAATYKFTNDFHVFVTPKDAESVTVIFEAIGPVVDISTTIKDFINVVADHQLRLQLDRSNGKIRDLIVAHAFSPLDLQKEVQSQ